MKGSLKLLQTSFANLVQELKQKPNTKKAGNAISEQVQADIKKKILEKAIRKNSNIKKTSRLIDQAVKSTTHEERIYGKMYKFEANDAVVHLINDLKVSKEAHTPIQHVKHSSGGLNEKYWFSGKESRKNYLGLKYFGGVQNNKFPQHSSSEVAIMGYSNVGKSFLINVLTKSTIVPAKNHAGVTGNIHFYKCSNNKGFIVDTPGYGFANTDDSTKKAWKSLLEAYIANRAHLADQFGSLSGISKKEQASFVKPPGLRKVYVILAANSGLRNLDIELFDYLESKRIPFTVILTKCDILPITMLAQRATVIDQYIAKYKSACGFPICQARTRPHHQLRCLLVSSITEAGIEHVHKDVFNVLRT